MESLKQFVNTLSDRLLKALSDGDASKVNEITSNLMLSAVILMMLGVSWVCLILNELRVFTADLVVMRATMIAMNIVEIPILMINKHYHGEPAWMRKVLVWGLLAICALLTGALGHNTTLVMAIPVILSIRYCDYEFTRQTVLGTLVLFTISCFVNAYYGIVNLNVYPVEEGTTLTIVSNLRQAILNSGIDHTAYLKNLLINDYLPRLMSFSVIGFSCIKIANRAKEMSDIQEQIGQKTARLETELNLATEIQAGMLPCIFPAFPEHGELDLYAINYPSKEVGGDFYDYFVIDSDHVAIVMADVSGKGVGAALFMTIAKIVLKNQLMALKDPALAMMNANNQLCENNEAQLFVTVWSGIYEISSRTLTYSNAGHNPPIFYRKGKSPEYLQAKKSFVMAGFPDTKYVNNTLELKEGDEIFLYTDGVTEANNKNKELFGEDRLVELYAKEIEKPVREQIEDVMDELRKFMSDTEQFDDITMLGMRVKEKN